MMNLTTPALLFPAISLLLLAYTNRFLTLAQVIRQLNSSVDRSGELVQRQLPGLKRRILLTKYMQGFGVFSFLLCALSMFALFMDADLPGKLLFGASILTLALSLVLSLIEVLLSTDALSLVVEDLESAKGAAQGSAKGG
jgi:small-conductance mechanosensitive channel